MISRKVYKSISISWLCISSGLYTIILRVLLHLNGIQFGRGIRTYRAVPKLRISIKSGNICLGDNILFNNYNDVSWYCKTMIQVKEGASFSMGDYSGMNGVLVYCSNCIIIGKHVKIGGGTRIIDTDFHNLNWQKRQTGDTDIAKSAPIIIKDDVFVGTNCIILKGVTIGERSIVAAGSVVTKDIPSDSIAAGNPAQIIRSVQR